MRPPEMDLRLEDLVPVAAQDAEIVMRIGVVRVDFEDLLEHRLQPVALSGLVGTSGCLQERADPGLVVRRNRAGLAVRCSSRFPPARSAVRSWVR